MLVSFDPNLWYRLTNASCGPENPLDIVNDRGYNSSGALKMAAWGNRGHSGQHWQFRPHEDNDGTYKLCTMFLGISKCLDVYGDDKTQPHLAHEGNFSGQKWWVVPGFKDGTWDGTYKMWNTYSGENLFLGSTETSRTLILGEGKLGGMQWTIVPIQTITSGEHLIR